MGGARNMHGGDGKYIDILENLPFKALQIYLSPRFPTLN